MTFRSTSTHLTHALVSAGQHWQTQRKEKKSTALAFTIAVSRQVGARGSSVAREIGARLGWPVYDRELLEQIESIGLLTGSIHEEMKSIAERQRANK